MSKEPQQLTSEELKEVQDFLKKRNIDVQIRFSMPKVKYVDDGGIIIPPPQFQTSFVKLEKETNGNGDIKAE